jgi:hypothetical protein
MKRVRVPTFASGAFKNDELVAHGDEFSRFLIDEFASPLLHFVGLSAMN